MGDDKRFHRDAGLLVQDGACLSEWISALQRESLYEVDGMGTSSIIEYLKTVEEATSTDIADHLGFCRKHVTKSLFRAYQKGMVTRVRRKECGTSFLYRIVPDFKTEGTYQDRVLNILKRGDAGIKEIENQSDISYSTIHASITHLRKKKLIHIVKWVKWDNSEKTRAIYRAGSGEDAPNPNPQKPPKPSPKPKAVSEPKLKAMPKPVEEIQLTCVACRLNETEKRNAEICRIWDAATKVAVNIRKQGVAA